MHILFYTQAVLMMKLFLRHWFSQKMFLMVSLVRIMNCLNYSRYVSGKISLNADHLLVLGVPV